MNRNPSVVILFFVLILAGFGFFIFRSNTSILENNQVSWVLSGKVLQNGLWINKSTGSSVQTWSEVSVSGTEVESNLASWSEISASGADLESNLVSWSEVSFSWVKVGETIFGNLLKVKSYTEYLNYLKDRAINKVSIQQSQIDVWEDSGIFYFGYVRPSFLYQYYKANHQISQDWISKFSDSKNPTIDALEFFQFCENYDTLEKLKTFLTTIGNDDKNMIQTKKNITLLWEGKITLTDFTKNIESIRDKDSGPIGELHAYYIINLASSWSIDCEKMIQVVTWNEWSLR